MQKKKILITGACGFIGKALLKRLSQGSYDLYVLDIRSVDTSEQNIIKKSYIQDLSVPFQLNEIFDFVFHLAAHNVTHVGSQEREAYQKINVEGTQNLLQAAEIKNFIFLSTVKVYTSEGKPIDEDSPLDPQRNYEKSKLEAEEVCRKQFHGQNLCVFRSVNIVGPRQDPKALIPVLFENALSGKPLDIFAPKSSQIQMIHVDDVVNIFQRFIDQGGKSGIFNISSGNKIRLDQLAEKIVQRCQSSSGINFSNDAPTIFSEIISEKARETFEWEPKKTIFTILEEYSQYLTPGKK